MDQLGQMLRVAVTTDFDAPPMIQSKHKETEDFSPVSPRNGLMEASNRRRVALARKDLRK
jgi:hypothetical protein